MGSPTDPSAMNGKSLAGACLGVLALAAIRRLSKPSCNDPKIVAAEHGRLTPAEAFRAFQEFVHEYTPDGYRYDSRRHWRRDRVLCGEHGRMVPRDGSCPVCGGFAVNITSDESTNRKANAK